MALSGRPIDPEPAPACGSAAPLDAEFLARLAAQLNAGLHGVLALTELLERQPLGGDAPAYVRTLADCGRTLINLLADAVELSGAAAAKPLRPEPVRLRDLLDEIQAEWLPRAMEDGVALGAVFKGDAGLTADLDADALRAVYGSLIGHALALTRRGGVEAALHAERCGDTVRLVGSVRDTGPHPSAEALAAYFAAFNGNRPAAVGAGLDLAIACRRMEAMGGRMRAEANAGLGATVTFELEARASRVPAADRDAAPPEPTALGGRVLIVDDNATNRIVARTLVEMFGCTCELAEDGIEAVEALSRGAFDAVLMDIRMPRLDGVAATRAIRALPAPACFTPVIALTANADPEDARAYLAAGMRSVVEKPIKPERLLLALSDAIGGRERTPSQAAA